MTPSQHAKVLEALEHHIEAALCSDDGMADRIMHMDKARKQLAAYREALSIMRSEGDRQIVGWLDGPFGAFRADKDFKLSGPQSVQWSLPVFIESAAPPLQQTEVKP